MLRQAEKITDRVYPVIFILKSAVVQTERLMKIGDYKSGIYFFGSLPGRLE